MLRVVLGVALAVALLATVTPALEDARATRTERLTARELGRVETAAQSLVSDDAPGARRVLTVTLPGRSPTTASLAYVAIGATPPGEADENPDRTASGVVVYRVAGRAEQVRRVETPLRANRSRPLVFRGGRTYQLTLRYVRVGGRPTVVASVRSESSESAEQANRRGPFYHRATQA